MSTNNRFSLGGVRFCISAVVLFGALGACAGFSPSEGRTEALQPVSANVSAPAAAAAAGPAREPPAAGSWVHQVDFDQVSATWTVTITSMVTRQLTCTVSWNGISIVGSTAGRRVRSSFTLLIPAYSGAGSAITG